MDYYLVILHMGNHFTIVHNKMALQASIPIVLIKIIVLNLAGITNLDTGHISLATSLNT